MLDPVIHKMITYVQNLEEKDLKDKVVYYIYTFWQVFVFTFVEKVPSIQFITVVKMMCFWLWLSNVITFVL